MEMVVDLDDAVAAGPDAVGVKGWSLARLRAHDMPTPDGFIVTTELYRRSVRAGRIERRLSTIWESARSASPTEIQQLARTARHLISALRIEPTVALDIVARVAAFGDSEEFAVRASAVADGVSGPVCSGVHSTFSGVIGAEAVISRIQGCWASLYGERALAMNARGLGGDEPTMAVIVQPMLRAEKSGLAVSLPPSFDVLVEATFGLGEPLVTGAVEPDRHVIDSSTGAIRSTSIGRKQIVLPADAHGRHQFAPLERQRQQALSTTELNDIAHLCARVSHSFGTPHEIEWLIDGSGPAVLQARAIEPDRQPIETSQDQVLTGVGVGSGTATGPVRVISSVSELASVAAGDVIVTRATTPEWRPHLIRACAIVTDTGDEHSHAAQVAMEYGIPAVVGAQGATIDLDDGSMATVDASRGWIFPAPLSERADDMARH